MRQVSIATPDHFGHKQNSFQAAPAGPSRRQRPARAPRTPGLVTPCSRRRPTFTHICVLVSSSHTRWRLGDTRHPGDSEILDEAPLSRHAPGIREIGHQCLKGEAAPIRSASFHKSLPSALSGCTVPIRPVPEWHGRTSGSRNGTWPSRPSIGCGTHSPPSPRGAPSGWTRVSFTSWQGTQTIPWAFLVRAGKGPGNPTDSSFNDYVRWKNTIKTARAIRPVRRDILPATIAFR